jgi:hypothetical protein
MNRSAGVTANAVVALVGSALVLAFGVLAILGMVMALQSAPFEAPREFPFPPGLLKTIIMLLPLIYILPAVWGLCTGVALLKLKNWARISIIVFAALMTFSGLFGAVGALAFTMISTTNNPELNRPEMAWVRGFMVVSALAELGLGIWWLVFFNLAKTRAQFQRPAPWTAVPSAGVQPPSSGPLQQVPSALPAQVGSGRPISITIIACYLLVGAPFALVNLALRMPAILFTTFLTGRAAVLYWLACLALLVGVGIGLLRLHPVARLVAMGYLVFSAVNSTLFFLAPGAHDRIQKLMDWQESIFPWMKIWRESPLQLDPVPLMSVGAVFGLIFLLVPLYFLFTARQAFAGPRAVKEP